MVPIEEYQRLQLASAIFIIISVIAVGLVYHYVWKNRDQYETVNALLQRIKDLNTRNISLNVRINQLKKVNKDLNKDLDSSTKYIQSLRIQLQAATKLLESKDNELTDKTWHIIDIQNDFDVFDAGYEELQTKYNELIKSQGQSS